MATKLYCLCRKPYEANDFMIECEICKDWFHGRCVNVKENQAADIETYHCPSCQLLGGPLKLKKRKNANSISESDENSTKTIRTGTMTFIRELKQRTFASAADIPLVRISGHELTKDYLEKSGFSLPIIVDRKDGLDLKVPPSNFTIQDVENYVGSSRELDVIDVMNQDDCKMLMNEWTEYFNSPDRQRIYNVISLEFSKTRLAELVEPPRTVKELSWINRFWPKASVHQPDQDTDRPEIQRYCLMGVKDSYTDFHIDFGGTSVWYHILWGEKVFYFIRPTPSNLALYERWLSSSSQKKTFFGDQVDACYRCVIKQGQTVLIPTGWIHAVLTPIDSLVFGGNFLHSYGIEMQLKVYEIEKRLKTPPKYLIPNFEALHWYAAGHFLDYLTECHIGGEMPPQYLIDGVKSLCSTLKGWVTRKDAGRSAVVPAILMPNKILKDLQKELKNFLNAKDRAALQELVLDDPSELSTTKTKRTRKKKSNVTLSPKKLPGASLMPESDDQVSLITLPVKQELVKKPSLFSGKLPRDDISSSLKDEKASHMSGDFTSVYDFKDDCIGELEVEVKDSDACWVDGLSSPPLKLKVTAGKISSKPRDRTNQRQFVKLSSLSQGSSTVSISNNLPVVGTMAPGFNSNSDSEEQLVVDEVYSGPVARDRGTAKSGDSSQISHKPSKRKLPASASGEDCGSPQSPNVEFAQRLSIPVIRGGLNSNISDILEASGYGTETDIRIDDDYSRASPTMRDAIQGMLSMSCGSRLMSGSSLLRSPLSSVTTPRTASWFTQKQGSLNSSADDIDTKLMTCYKDSEFVYPSLDLSDSEDTSKSKSRAQSDDNWNPKAKVTPGVPKKNRPPREGARRESVQSGLAAAAAKLADVPPEKRTYAKRKLKQSKKVKLPEGPDRQTGLASSALVSLSGMPAIGSPVSANTSNTVTSSVMPSTTAVGPVKPPTPASQPKGPLPPKKFKKGQATAKQRLASKLKMHKMMF